MPPAEPSELLASLEVLRGRTYTATPLAGGLTNVNYRVQTADDPPLDLVVRVSSNETGMLAIDRANERHNTRMAWQAGVGAPVVEAIPEAGLLVIGFLPGRTLTADDLQDPVYIARVAAALRRLHDGPAFQGTFDMRAIRRGYLANVIASGFRLPADYLELAERVERIEAAMLPGSEPLVPCNNDLLAANFIDDGIDLSATELLVESYWGRPSAVKLARARAWSLLARYGWTLWASIQEGVSPIDFDFWSWGMLKYESARAELLGPVYDEILAGLSRTDAP